MAPSADTIMHSVDELAPVIEAAADRLWDFAEIRYEEVRSSAYLREILEEHGFAITRDSVAGIPTAFVAEIGSGEPVIGILAEYDALPGLGNAAVPRKEPRPDGRTAGHGCTGHVMFGQLLADDRIEERWHVSPVGRRGCFLTY